MLEKATYIAQLSAALSLLPTVVFAWLGWREVRSSRIEQMQFFVAEKAPEIDISSIKIIRSDGNDVLTVFVKNVGASPARPVTFALIKIGEIKPFVDSRDDVLRDLGLDRGQEFRFPLVKAEELQKQFGWRPDTVRIFDIGDTLEKGEEETAVLEIRFFGQFNDEHVLLRTLAMKRSISNNSSSRDAQLCR